MIQYPKWYPPFSDVGTEFPEYDEAIRHAIEAAFNTQWEPSMNEFIDTGYQHGIAHHHIYLIHTMGWERYVIVVGTRLYLEWIAILREESMED